MLGQVNRG